MNRKKRAQKVQDILDEYIPKPTIPLDHKDPYTLLIAVLLSAQCTDRRVNQVTPTLFALADNPRDMAEVSVEKIEACIRTCGLAPSKARSIHSLSQILLERYNGVVPETFEDLESLPGVGHKTASVVMAQAFDQPAFPVDTHIHRCAKRWGLSCGKSVIQTEKDLKQLFPQHDWTTLHLQIILFAREYCPARQHEASCCPICFVLKVES